MIKMYACKQYSWNLLDIENFPKFLNLTCYDANFLRTM
jgi:hypothetical protein